MHLSAFVKSNLKEGTETPVNVHLDHLHCAFDVIVVSQLIGTPLDITLAQEAKRLITIGLTDFE